METKSVEQQLADEELLLVSLRRKKREASINLRAAKSKLLLRFRVDADAQGKSISFAQAQEMVQSELVGGRLSTEWQDWISAMSTEEVQKMKVEHLTRTYLDNKDTR